MALTITFYDGIKYHRQDFINRDADFLGSGVVHLTDFPYSFDATAYMNIIIGAGVAWVDGYRIQNDSTSSVTLTVPAADATNPRIDIVQIGHDDVNSAPSLVLKKGVAAASPIEPGADAGYLKLFAINVPANATSITSSNIIDRRVLVPLNVSGDQISYGGAASTTKPNTFTQTQTFSDGSAPINIPNQTALPAVGPKDTLCVVNNMWYRSDGTNWIAMAPPAPPNASTTQAGIVELTDSVTSTSTTTAATPNSVKSANDNANSKYTKPSSGIPKTDLESAVQTSLGKADTALQAIPAASSTQAGLVEVVETPVSGTPVTPTRCASFQETLITGTSAQTVLTYTPQANHNFELNLYFRVITAATTVTITVTYTDAGGAETYNVLNAQSCAVGQYSCVPFPFNALTTRAITVSVTAGTANQVYASGALTAV